MILILHDISEFNAQMWSNLVFFEMHLFASKAVVKFDLFFFKTDMFSFTSSQHVPSNHPISRMVARDITSDLNRNCRAIDDVAPHKIHNSNLVNPQKKHKKKLL